MLSLRNSNHDPLIDLYDLEGSDEGDMEIDSLTEEHLDTLLIGDEVISTIPAREINEFIKSSVDDLVLIPRESKVTSDREQVVDFLMENEDVAGLPRHLVKQFFSHLVKNLSSTKRMSDEPLGDDSKPRSYDFEHISSLDPPESTPVIDEFTLLVTPPPASKQLSLWEVERFDPFFSLAQSGGKTSVMETSSFGFHHMLSPRPVAYSPKEVMYRYYHPHLTSGDGFDLEIKSK
ncbi:hypothetical protein Tco_0728881 [Tanacetum coccineum]|uniref:Uncharacterized protein n=1 Tax=Tanacetum coccineum TaxID=301880 RepID=A0ABQ4YPT3_9ASTR